MGQFKKSVLGVVVYYYHDQFYVFAQMELPPIYAWKIVPPRFTAPKGESDKLAQAIESARLISKPREQLTPSDVKERIWSSEEEEVQNKALKLWSVQWDEEGNVSITSWEHFPPGDYKGVAWRPIKDSEIILSPPVHLSDISQTIINQI